MGGEMESSCGGAMLIGSAWGRGACRTGGCFNDVIMTNVETKLLYKRK